MPVYTFVCDECDISEERVLSMKNADVPQDCERGHIMRRDFQADLPFASGGDYHRPIVSDSLAISPEQIAEHKQLFPDIQVTSEGQLVFDNYKPHDKYLEATGFRKKRKRRRRVPTSVIGGKENSKTKT